jgi:outer membrane protein assembly factor BamB
MSARRIVTVSLVLAGLVLLNAFGLSCRLGTRVTRSALQQQWQARAGAVQTLVLARFKPGGVDSLAQLGTSGVRLLAGDGKALVVLDEPGGIAASATGDMDADGADEVWIVRRSGPPYSADALGSELETKLKVPLQGASLPTRILPVDLDGDGRCEIVVADDKGSLLAYDLKGRKLWARAAPSAWTAAEAEVRGLDDVKEGKERRVAAAHLGGHVVLLDAAGLEVWHRQAGKLRRMRSFDADGDGSGDVLLGTEAGQYLAVSASGKELASQSLGEAVTEIRPLEVDGDPRRAEVFLGGKKGAWAVLSGNQVLRRGSLDARVSAARGIDTDGDGRDEVFVATENGRLYALSSEGRVLAQVATSGKPEALGAVVSALRDRLAVVGSASGVAAYRLSRITAPPWFSPWTAAAVGWLTIAGVALVLLRLPPEQPLRAVSPPKPQPALVQARALEAAAERIRAWVQAGKLREEDAAFRLQQIRKRLAENAPARPQG